MDRTADCNLVFLSLTVLCFFLILGIQPLIWIITLSTSKGCNSNALSSILQDKNLGLPSNLLPKFLEPVSLVEQGWKSGMPVPYCFPNYLRLKCPPFCLLIVDLLIRLQYTRSFGKLWFKRNYNRITALILEFQIVER